MKHLHPLYTMVHDHSFCPIIALGAILLLLLLLLFVCQSKASIVVRVYFVLSQIAWFTTILLQKANSLQCQVFK